MNSDRRDRTVNPLAPARRTAGTIVYACLMLYLFAWNPGNAAVIAAVYQENGKPAITSDGSLTIVGIDKGRKDGISEGNLLDIVAGARSPADRIGYATVIMAYENTAFLRVERPRNLQAGANLRFVKPDEVKSQEPYGQVQWVRSAHVNHLSFLNNDKWLLTGDNKQFSIWEIHSGRKILSRSVSGINFDAYALAPLADRLLTLNHGNMIYSWDLKTWAVTESIQLKASPSSGPLAVSANGSVVVASTAGAGPVVFKGGLRSAVEKLYEARSDFPSTAPVAVSASGQYFATQSTQMIRREGKLMTPRRFRLLNSHTGHHVDLGQQKPDSRVAEFTPDEKYFIHDDGEVLKFWTLDGVLARSIDLDGKRISALAVAPNNASFVVNTEGIVRIRTHPIC